MCTTKAMQLALFAAVFAVAVAEPPAAYGPPGYRNQVSGVFDQGYQGFRQQSTAFQGFQGHNRGFQGNYQGNFQGGYQGGYRGYQDNYDNGAPQPFSFQYEVKDAASGNDFGHRAVSDGRQVTGQYEVLLPDGRRQIVKYVADDNGYNADVQYEGQARISQPAVGGYQQPNYQYQAGQAAYQGNFQAGHGGYQGGHSGFQGSHGGFQGSHSGFQGGHSGFQGSHGGFQGGYKQGGFTGYRY